MEEELIKQLVSIFNEEDCEEESTFELDGNVLIMKLVKEGNKVNLSLEWKEDEFKKYVNSLDEDIFLEACEKFEELTGKPLSDNTNPEQFKAVVKQLISSKIDRLKAFI